MHISSLIAFIAIFARVPSNAASICTCNVGDNCITYELHDCCLDANILCYCKDNGKYPEFQGNFAIMTCDKGCATQDGPEYRCNGTKYNIAIINSNR